MRHARLPLFVAALTLTIGGQAAAQVRANPSYAPPMTSTGPSDPALAVGPRDRAVTQASQRVLAGKLVTLINAGKCDQARRLASNDRDGGFEMLARVRHFCSKARHPG